MPDRSDPSDDTNDLPPRPAPDGSWGQLARDALAARGIGVVRVAAGAAAVIAAAVVAWWLLRPPAPPVEASLPVATAPPAPLPASTTTPSSASLLVHAAGAVARPGVVEVPSGARVADVVDAAGGLAGDADTERLNLAAQVVDGARVYVPRVGQAEVPPAEPSGSAVDSGAPSGAAGSGPSPAAPVDLNTATETELDTLPGIGPTTAAAIVTHRSEHGPFRTVDDLLDVRGIGDAKLAELRDSVTV